MRKNKKLIIIGDSSFAAVAYEYFTYDSEYEVVAFSVEARYLKKTSWFNLPVIPFEELTQKFAINEHSFFVAIVYSQLNRLRTRLYQTMKLQGYQPASYISTCSFIWRNVTMGEHCFVFENNVIQPYVRIGNNVILWSGNHIGHHSQIADNCFMSSHVVVSGHSIISKNCFLGVNATLTNNITIAADCIISAGAVVNKDTREREIYIGNPGVVSKVSSFKYFKVTEK